jgi:hypothetical protein
MFFFTVNFLVLPELGTRSHASLPYFQEASVLAHLLTLRISEAVGRHPEMAGFTTENFHILADLHHQK